MPPARLAPGRRRGTAHPSTRRAAAYLFALAYAASFITYRIAFITYRIALAVGG